MTKPRTLWRDIVDSYPCPTCDAAPGEDCHTTSGAAKYEPHAPRSRLASTNAWRFADERESRCIRCGADVPANHEQPLDVEGPTCNDCRAPAEP